MTHPCAFLCKLKPFFRFAVIHLRQIKLLLDNALHRMLSANAKWKSRIKSFENQHQIGCMRVEGGSSFD